MKKILLLTLAVLCLFATGCSGFKVEQGLHESRILHEDSGVEFHLPNRWYKAPGSWTRAVHCDRAWWVEGAVETNLGYPALGVRIYDNAFMRTGVALFLGDRRKYEQDLEKRLQKPNSQFRLIDWATTVKNGYIHTVEIVSQNLVNGIKQKELLRFEFRKDAIIQLYYIDRVNAPSPYRTDFDNMLVAP